MLLRLPAALLLMLAIGGCGHAKTPFQPGPTDPPPQLACASNMSVTITGMTQTVTYAAPVASNGTQPVSVTCSPASGTAFSLGTTTVSCIATDANSRQAACFFTVTANGVQLGAKKFSAIGDSLTEGENGLSGTNVFLPLFTDQPNAYPTKLLGLLNATYPSQGITIANHGIGGRTTDQTLAEMPIFLNADNPEVVLLLTGANDIDFPCGAGRNDDVLCDMAVDAVETNLRQIIRQAKNFPGVRYVFVSTLMPGRPNGRLTIEPSRIVDTNNHIRAAINAEGALLVDPYPLFLGHEADYVSPDGLHLLPPGYQVLAQTFYDKIIATIPQSKPLSFR